MFSSLVSKSGSPESLNSMLNFWTSLKETPEDVVERGAQSANSTINSINWMVVNRGGMAQITGLCLIPAHSLETEEKILKKIQMKCTVEPFRYETKNGDKISGIIYYPEDFNKNSVNRCVLYHNPNGISLTGYFENYGLSYTPAAIVKLRNCPIILYDYRGTGLSQDPLSTTTFHPTFRTVLEDGLTAMEYARKSFHNVEVWGSSLGGLVATKSLKRHLETFPADENHVALINHDSCMASTKLFSNKVLGTISWGIGGKIDAANSLKKLVDRGIRVYVLCHLNDPVIPEEARMANHAATLKNNGNLSIIYSDRYGHANLSADMLRDMNALKI